MPAGRSSSRGETSIPLRSSRIFLATFAVKILLPLRKPEINLRGRKETPKERNQTNLGLIIFVITNILDVVVKSIQTEIQQSKPFGTLEEEALVTLQRTADRLHWRLSEMLKTHGLSPTQYNALRILRGARDEGRACSEIAERMINRDPDITRLVDRLERRGLVARSREGRDRRVITTRITPAGLKLLESLDRPIEDLNRKLLGPLGEQRLRTLIQLLDAAREQSD
jgi:DNA-binding MarR family transcriptional regulator